MLRSLLFAASILSPSLAAGAGPDRVSFLLASHHVNPEEDFEEVNPGLFLTWAGELNPTLGVFRNSYGEAAPTVTVSRAFWESGDLALAVTAGVAVHSGDGDRFDIAIGDVVPLLGLRADLGPVFVQAFPGDGQAADAVFAFGVTFGLD